MPTQLASIPPLPGYGINQPPEIQGAIVDTKTQPRGDQLIGQATQIRALTLTSAQLLALKATDVQLVEAPGVGYVHHLEGVSLRLNFGTVAYTLNAGTLKVYMGASSAGLAQTADLAALLNAGASSVNVGVPALATGVTAKANAENKPLVLGNTGAAEFTLGDGTLDVVVVYSTLQI